MIAIARANFASDGQARACDRIHSHVTITKVTRLQLRLVSEFMGGVLE